MNATSSVVVPGSQKRHAQPARFDEDGVCHGMRHSEGTQQELGRFRLECENGLPLTRLDRTR
jgi:hypothetical protein